MLGTELRSPFSGMKSDVLTSFNPSCWKAERSLQIHYESSWFKLSISEIIWLLSKLFGWRPKLKQTHSHVGFSPSIESWSHHDKGQVCFVVDGVQVQLNFCIVWESDQSNAGLSWTYVEGIDEAVHVVNDQVPVAFSFVSDGPRTIQKKPNVNRVTGTICKTGSF